MVPHSNGNICGMEHPVEQERLDHQGVHLQVTKYPYHEQPSIVDHEQNSDYPGHTPGHSLQAEGQAVALSEEEANSVHLLHNV